MPEVTDADMHFQEEDIAGEYTGPFRKQYSLFLGVWSQFCYVGAQVAVANRFINFCERLVIALLCLVSNKKLAKYSSFLGLYTNILLANLLAIGQGLYAFNRFLAAVLMAMKAFKPRYILVVYLGLCFNLLWRRLGHMDILASRC